MHKVNTNPQVIQLYVDQAFPKVTNRQESLWFKGTELYSYESLLAIIDPANKVLFVDKDIKSYSNTTAKHSALLFSRALRANYRIFTIPLEVPPEEVLMYYWNLVEGSIAKYVKVTKTKEQHKLNIKGYLAQAEAYAEYTQVNKKSKEYKYKTKLVKQLFEHKLL